MNKLRKGDQVIVISGRDKGKSGVVLRRIDPDHLVVEGINIVKKHVRPNPMKGEQATPQATETLRLETLPIIGRLTRASACSRTRRRIPLSSDPKISRCG